MLPSLDAAWRRFRPFEAGAPYIQPMAARRPADRCPVFCPSSSGSSLLPLPWPRFLLDFTARFLPSPAPVSIVVAVGPWHYGQLLEISLMYWTGCMRMCFVPQVPRVPALSICARKSQRRARARSGAANPASLLVVSQLRVCPS
jgi:hypothetical protein